MERVDKINYYLDIAERGTCIRNNYGSVIVKNDEIISTGYTGAPRGRMNCIDLGYCKRRGKYNARKKFKNRCSKRHWNNFSCIRTCLSG